MTTYAYLGPAGTFTEAALRQITNESDVLVPYSNVTAALDAVRNGKAEKVLVPIENSVEGVVSRTLDELALGTPLVVTAETTLPVTFSLMTLPDRAGDEITKIATHPHAESQCRSYVAKNYPQAEIIEMSSTAAAAKGLANGNYDAAIASDIAAKNYGLKIIASNIGDNAGAVTRFVVAEKPGTMPPPTGNDRTSLVAFIGIDHAGALLEILTEFAKRDVNLTFIQSRPTGLELGHYHFIIDAEGHIADPKVAAAVDGVRNISEDIRFLGSYPRVGKSN
ncbi:MAG: prephenate dehydratase [Actinobacteria bacterium]|jgi:prephenate dehydratase|nr:prephenate dehydratase [Actinomycetota bacterium]